MAPHISEQTDQQILLCRAQSVDPFVHLTIYIIRVTLNTKFDTVRLSGRHTQIKRFGVCPLVCPYSIWPGQGFYVAPFLIDAIPSEQQSK